MTTGLPCPYFLQGWLIRFELPVTEVRAAHLTIYSYQGADEDPEKLGLADRLSGAALCELAVGSVVVSLVSYVETSMWSPPRYLAC